MPDAFSVQYAEDISINPKNITKLIERIDFTIFIFIFLLFFMDCYLLCNL